jgi:DNA-directed RNA polymerase specialized sigma24 family protein
VETQRTEPTVSLPPWSIDEGVALRDARSGDADAFRGLVSHHQAQVFGTALRLTSRRAAAATLAQETFVALHGALPRISNPTHLQRWLSRAIEQRSADWLRQQARGDVVLVEEAGERVSATEAAHAAGTDPGAEFTAAVMVRLEQRRTHRQQFLASRGHGRRGGRRILWATLLVAVVALAVLGLHWAGLLWPVSGGMATPASVAATSAMEGSSSPAGPSAPVNDAAGSATAASSATAAPVAGDLYPRYTLIALPPRQQTQEASAIAAVEAFHAALLETLRELPGLTVLTPGITAPPVDANHPAEYLLTVTGLQLTTLASGSLAFRISGGGSGGAVATGSAQQWPVEIRLQPVGQPASSAFSSALQVGAEGSAALAAQQVQMLRTRFFPDALVRQQQLLRLSDAAASGLERDHVLSELLDTPPQGRALALDAPSIAVILQQAAVLRADQRAQLWRSLRGYSGPELVEPLLDALRRDPQEDVRFEALATLTASHVNEPRVRTVLETIAKEDAQPVMRMAARRALGDAAEWRSYVVATLADASLPYAERLVPLLMAIRSATLPAERQDAQGLARDAQVQNQLAAMVREGWFDAVQADSVGAALGLLADGGSTPTAALLVQVQQQGPQPAAPVVAPPVVVPPVVAPPPPVPQISPATMAWLLSHRNNPLARRMLDDIARGNPDPRLEFMVEQLRRAEQMQRVPQRR